MKSHRSLDFGAGIFMLLGFAAIAYLVLQTTDLRSYRVGDGYSVTARFTNIGDLRERAPVQIAGVSIGEVKQVTFDQDTFEAVVELSINEDFDAIPDDSSAKIATAGLLGRKYVALEPGGSPDYLSDGSEIFITQSAIVLEDLIGKYVFSAGDDGAPDIE